MCKQFGLYGLFLCRSKCENSGNRCIIYKNVYKRNRKNKYNEICAYNYYKKHAMYIIYPELINGLVINAMKIKHVSYIDNMYSVYKTCSIHIIKESLCVISKKEIFVKILLLIIKI